MPKDDTNLPPPVPVAELLADDGGPRPGLMYLTKSEFGGVKMTENDTFLGAGPDPNEAPLKERRRTYSDEDKKKVDALSRALEAQAQGRKPTRSVLEAFHQPAEAAQPRPSTVVTTAPGGRRGRPETSPQHVRGRSLLLLGAGAAGVLVAGALALFTWVAREHPRASDGDGVSHEVPSPVRPLNSTTNANPIGSATAAPVAVSSASARPVPIAQPAAPRIAESTAAGSRAPSPPVFGRTRPLAPAASSAPVSAHRAPAIDLGAVTDKFDSTPLESR